MKLSLKTTLACTLAGFYTAPIHAAGLNLEIELPRMDQAEYHRPYVAVWLQSADRKTVRDIAVWYDNGKHNAEGQKWLKDLRQWWRLSGRGQDEPADGVTGATQAAGKHTIEVAATHSALADLPAGDYEVVVEAAREKGGRELLRLPLAWPAKQAATAEAQGDSELGHVQATLTP